MTRPIENNPPRPRQSFWFHLRIILGIFAAYALLLFFGCMLSHGGDRPATPEEIRANACIRFPTPDCPPSSASGRPQ